MNVLQDYLVLVFSSVVCVYVIATELQFSTIHGGFGDFSHT